MTLAFEVAASAKGWLHDDEGPALNRYALASPDGLPMLEVGTYCGKSTCWIGQAAQQRDLVLFTVDHHRGSPEMSKGQTCHDPDVLDDQGRHDTLPTLRRTLAAADLEDVVIPVVASSTTVGRWWTTPVGFVFIDGGHDAETAVADYDNFSPWLAPGGYLIFHDAYGTDANAAVVKALAAGFEQVENPGDMAVLTR